MNGAATGHRVARADARMTTTSVMSTRAVVSVTRGRHRGRDAMMTVTMKMTMTMKMTRPGARAARRATVTLARTGDEARDDDDDDSRTLSSSSSLLDALEDACPVPRDQRPASQYEELRDGALTSWPGLGVGPYVRRVLALFTFFYVVIAYPIACGSYDPNTQFVEACVSACVGASGATAAMTLSAYNGWSYVRDRLLSATVEYEETGWYDGQVYVKDPEMLARDRLLGTYEVRPVVETLRRTLVGCGAAALTSLAALRLIDAPNGEMNGDYGSNMGYYTETSAAKFEEEEEEEARMMTESMESPSVFAAESEET